jgi:hypothetical protein
LSILQNYVIIQLSKIGGLKMATKDFVTLRKKLFTFRKEVKGWSREKMSSQLGDGLSMGGLTKIEKGERLPNEETLATFMVYFQSIDHSEIILTLLRCIGTDTQALATQLEAAAWHYPPELPPFGTGDVLVTLSKKYPWAFGVMKATYQGHRGGDWKMYKPVNGDGHYIPPKFIVAWRYIPKAAKAKEGEPNER